MRGLEHYLNDFMRQPTDSTELKGTYLFEFYYKKKDHRQIIIIFFLTMSIFA